MTAKYTLPGVMQYLQTQFSQAERNRMQADLEKSSLKLKIIELEHERNTLVRRNHILEAKLSQLGHPSDPQENTSLDDVESIDVDKLIKAKQFLKSATNEIIYLLKTPLVEIDEPVLPLESTLSHDQSLPSRDNQLSPLADLGEPFKSIPDDLSDQDTIIDAGHDEDDDEDGELNNNINGDNDNEYRNGQKEKVFHLLKKPAKSTDVDIKLLEFTADLELKSGNLLIKYPKSNLINVHSIKSNELICSVNLLSDQISHLKSNGNFIIFTTQTSLYVNPISHSQFRKPISIDLESPVIQLDLNDDNIIITTSNSIQLFSIDDDEIKLISKHPLQDDIKEVNEIKLIDHHPKYDLAILTPISILFFNIENGINNEPLQLLNDIQLTNYKKWYLTPLNLIVQFEHGLYLMDLEDNSEFKNIPVSISGNFDIGSSFDDDSVFYIWQDSKIKVFQNTSIGTINQIKSLDNIQRNCCIGNVSGNERLLLEVKDQKIVLHHI